MLIESLLGATLESIHHVTGLIADIAGVVVFIVVILYFGWRWHIGYFHPSATISLEANRQGADGGTDNIALAIRIERGPLGGSLYLLDAQVLLVTATRQIATVNVPRRQGYRGFLQLLGAWPSHPT